MKIHKDVKQSYKNTNLMINTTNACNPTMNTFDNVSPMPAGAPMTPQEMMSMWMQYMSSPMMAGQMPQMMQGQVPQMMMVPWFPPMPPQVQMNQQGQPQQPTTTSGTLPSVNSDGKSKVEDEESKDTLLTKSEVSKMLHASDTTLWRRHKDGTLRYYKEGGRDVYKKDEVMRYINSLKHE